MLCSACQRKPNCLPQTFAKKDRRIRQLLKHLKQCDRRIVKS